MSLIITNFIMSPKPDCDLCSIIILNIVLGDVKLGEVEIKGKKAKICYV